VPHVEVRNPGAGGGCTADCVREAAGYDALGNRELATVDGGYGTGFGSLTLTTRTGYRHGRPVRRQLESGGASHLRWQREVDAGTGLVRWHVAGNGSGFAYGYDAVGRLTELAPVEGDLTGGEWRPSRCGRWTARPWWAATSRLPGASRLPGWLHDAAYVYLLAQRRLRLRRPDRVRSISTVSDGSRGSRSATHRLRGAHPLSSTSTDGFDPCGTGQGTALAHLADHAASEWRTRLSGRLR
jgi:hypothetical protein